MAYIIAEPCIGTKDTACVDACPVDCIHPKKDDPKHESEEMLYIDPVECIDCGLRPVCPVSAIFALDDLPENGTTSRPATRLTSAVKSSSRFCRRGIFTRAGFESRPPRNFFNFPFN